MGFAPPPPLEAFSQDSIGTIDFLKVRIRREFSTTEPELIASTTPRAASNTKAPRRMSLITTLRENASAAVAGSGSAEGPASQHARTGERERGGGEDGGDSNF